MEVPQAPLGATEERGVFRSVLQIGLPVAGTQFAFMLLGVVDTALLGHSSELELAASAIANMWNWAFLSLALGAVLGAEPFISQAVGRKDSESAALGLQHAIVTALLASIPTSILLLYTEPALLWLGQAPNVAKLAAEYNWIRLPSVPAFLVFVALRIFLQGLSKTSPALYVAIFANVLNFAFGAALIFGYGPVPALGLRGAAIAATLTSVLLPLLLWAWIRATKLDEGYQRRWDRRSFAPSGLKKVFSIGGPMAIQTSVEAWGFVLALMLAGWLGTTELSAHQISMNVAALAFMIPLGIAIGGATSVGHAIGAQNSQRAREALRASFALAALWSLVATPSLYFGRHAIASAFTSDTSLQASVATLVLFVAGFQFIDCAQAVGAGVLRGMGKPFGPALLNFVGFALGLPLAYYLGTHTQLGVMAVWIGLTFRMVVVSSGVTLWAHWMARRPLSELTVRH